MRRGNEFEIQYTSPTPIIILGLDPRIQKRGQAMGGTVYIMASKRNGTLYIGVTNDLASRAYEHKMGLIEGFSKKYGCTILVRYEDHEHIADAIQREKSLKRWKRKWKLALIEKNNPGWEDLYGEMGW